MTDTPFYPELACFRAPLRAENIPLHCSCVICQRREATLHDTRATPMACPVCQTDPDTYYGRLVFAGDAEPAVCPNHQAVVFLRPT